MKKIVKVVIALIIVALLVVLGIRKIKAKKEAESKIPTAKIYPIVVDKFTPKVANVSLSLPYLAIVQDDNDLAINSRIAARVQAISQSGTKVKKGEVIAKLDTTTINSKISSIKSQIEAAKISLNNLILTHKRTASLLKIKGASIEQYQKEQSNIAALKSKIASLKSSLNELKENLSYAILRSPVEGVVSKTFVSKGQVAMPGKPLLKISSNGTNKYLLLRLPPQIKPKGVIFNGKKLDVIALNSMFNGLAEYRVNLKNSNLISGDRVEVSVIVFDSKAIKLPFDTLLNRDGKSYVLQINGNRAIAKEIKIAAKGQEGVATTTLINGNIVLAKPDILLRLLGGYPLKIKDR